MIGDKCYTENETNQESTIKVNWLFILGVACICLIIFVISYNNEKSNISNALNQNDEVEEIINNLKNKEIGSTFISSVKLLGSGNELLGLEEQYFAKIKVDLSDNDGVNVSKSATIELFKNAEELEARRRYLEAKNDYLDKIYNNKYGKIVCMSNNVPVKQYLYVSGNGLLYFNETFAEGYKYDLCVQFDEAISSMKYFDNKKFNHSQVERIVKQNKRNLDNWKRKNLKKDILPKLKETKDRINEHIECICASGKIEWINQGINELRGYYTVAFRDDYIKWEKMLKETKENCEKGIVSQETLETQTKFKQKVFTEGTYKIGTDILPGEYVFIKNEDAETIQVKFGLDYFRYLSGNIDTLKILPTLNVDDDNNEFTLKGGTMYHIDNSPQLAINGPGVYKVGKTIPAGQYEVKKSHYISGPYYLASENNYELFNVYSDYKSNNIYHLNYEGYDRKNKESHYAPENGEIITLIQGQYLIILEDTIKFYKK